MKIADPLTRDFPVLENKSRKPRVSISVYDPADHKGYILDSYNFSYRIESCDEDELVVIKYEPRKNIEITGTVIVENDELVFVEN